MPIDIPQFDPGRGERAAKKPYRRPRKLYAEPLEVIAAVCSPGKALGMPGACALNANS